MVAAIHGACLGGGLETALACRYRVASDDPKTVVGLPEVMLGLIPGAGGTQRLPRLIGLRAALDLILTGRSLKAPRALRAGIVDEVVPAPVLVEAARAAAIRLAGGEAPPARPGISATERLLRPVIFRKARESVREKTGGHYPAPPAAIDVGGGGHGGHARPRAGDRGARSSARWPCPTSRARWSPCSWPPRRSRRTPGYPRGHAAARGRASSRWWARG